MIQLSYLSAPSRPMSVDDLMDILNKSRENNARLGISGMLLFTGEWFIQVLEGDEKIVDRFDRVLELRDGLLV